LGKGIRFPNEARIVIATQKLDVVAQRIRVRQPAHHITETTTNVDDSIWRTHTGGAKCSEHREEQAFHTGALLELFTQSLQFEVAMYKYGIDECIVQTAIAMGPPFDDGFGT
jgi:hypothetical protein